MGRIAARCIARDESAVRRYDPARGRTLTRLSKIHVLIFLLWPALAGATPVGGEDITVDVAKDGNSFAVTADMSVMASPDEVWNVLTDFEHMASFLSNVDSSRVANRVGNRFDVVQKSHTSSGPVHLSLDSVRTVDLVPTREIRSHLTKGNLKSADFTTRIAKQAGLTRISVSGNFVAEGLATVAITPEAVRVQTQRQYQEIREEILRRKAKQPTPPCLLAKNCSEGSG